MPEQELSKLSSAELSVYTNGTLSAQFLRLSVDDGQATRDEAPDKLELSYIDDIPSAPLPVLQISSADKFLISEANLKECKKSPTMDYKFEMPTIPSPQSANERDCFHLGESKLHPSQLDDRDKISFFKSIYSVGLDKEGRLAGNFCHVTYKDGVVIGEHYKCLNLECGPAGRDVERWF